MTRWLLNNDEVRVRELTVCWTMACVLVACDERCWGDARIGSLAASGLCVSLVSASALPAGACVGVVQASPV